MHSLDATLKVFAAASFLMPAIHGTIAGSKQRVQFQLSESDDGKHFDGLLAYHSLINGTFDIWRENCTSFNLSLDLKEPLKAIMTASFVENEGSYDMSIRSKPFLDLEANVIFHKSGEEKEDPSGYAIRTEAIFNSSILSFGGRYSLHARRQYSSCPYLTLSHSITTEPQQFLKFESNVWQSCGPSDSRLFINLTLDSILSPLISTRLDQVWVFKPSGDGWESMNATNPLMDIFVNAEWDHLFNHKKRALFVTSQLLEWIPKIELIYQKSPSNVSFAVASNFSKESNVHDEL